jgi:hypothetical protein
MAMICSSENLLLRIVRLLSGGYGLYPNLEEIDGLRSASIQKLSIAARDELLSTKPVTTYSVPETATAPIALSGLGAVQNGRSFAI